MTTLRRLGIATALALTATAAPSTPVGAATTPVAGKIVVDQTHSTCPGPPSGFEDYIDFDPFIVSGDLEGCWYVNIDRASDLGPPSGIYVEFGRDVFVGRLRGGPNGTFSTTYTYESRWDPGVAIGTEIWGRCQHLIVSGSGTGGLHGVTGHLLRPDVATDGSGSYRGFVRQP
jgi:hypothetical protein